MLTRAFRDTPAAVVGPGSHTVLMSGPSHDLARFPVRMALLSNAVAALAHLPVRSAAQVMRKVAIGWAAHRAAGRTDPTLAFHWRELAESFERDGPPDAARLRDISLNYGIPMSRWVASDEVRLVRDPLELQGAPRHATPAAPPTSSQE